MWITTSRSEDRVLRSFKPARGTDSNLRPPGPEAGNIHKSKHLTILIVVLQSRKSFWFMSRRFSHIQLGTFLRLPSKRRLPIGRHGLALLPALDSPVQIPGRVDFFPRVPKTKVLRENRSGINHEKRVSRYQSTTDTYFRIARNPIGIVGKDFMRLPRYRYTCEMRKKLRFLVSLHSCENDFQVAQAETAKDTAHKLGSDAEIVFADDDAVNQSIQLLKAIQSRVESRPDAIVVEPVGGTALPRVARAASAAGIGWAILNRMPDYLSDLRTAATVPIFAVSSDHFEIGCIQGRQFAALLPGGGSVLYIQGPSQSSSAQARTSGMLKTKPSNIQVRMLKARWTEESARLAVRSWLKMATSQSASINLVGAQDDSMAMGARKAFQEITTEAERSRWLSLPFTGCDGQLATGQAWVRKKWLTATIHIPPLTGQAMEILAKAIEDRIQPPEHSLTTSFSIPPLESLVPRNP